MTGIGIEYNVKLKALEALLSDVKRPGGFYSAGSVEIPMPRVEVTGAGTLSFPIPGSQIQALVEQAAQAPYGRGEQTIVDTNVRNVWQIDAGAVRIGGKSWEASFQQILSQVTRGLGCQKVAVSAQLYKMLVYDRDGFFLPHRDTEKTARMFGTLVVTLPCFHQGGALRIRHGDREVTLATEAAEPSEVSFAAFYADCEHEVLPVKEGARVCLVYNLIQERTKSRTLQAPDYESVVGSTAEQLRKLWNWRDAPAKIVWLLEHQYSPAGLSFASLKGADAARAGVLLQAADRAGCAVYLGVVHIGETGGAEWDGPGFGDEDEDEDVDDEDFTPISVDDTWRYLDEWRDREDSAVAFGRVPLQDSELLPIGALDREPADEKRLTEASGNEGATYERSYHRAALVLWPTKRTVEVLLEGGVGAALPYLMGLVARGTSARSQAVEAAQRIVDFWPKATRGVGYLGGVLPAAPADRVRMIAALAELDKPALLERFIREAVAATYDGTENAALAASVPVLGLGKAGSVLAALLEARMADQPSACVELLLCVCKEPSPSLRRVAEAAVEGLARIAAPKAEADALWGWRVAASVPPRQRRLEPPFLVHLFTALGQFKGAKLCLAAAEKIASRPEVFPPVGVVVPAIEGICGRDDMPPAVDTAVRHLWASAAEFLLRRSESPPQPPRDWRLEAKFSCTCADCRELLAFARDPKERVHRFRVKKERRGHLHMTIERHRLAITHVTERLGSPQTLVCTKDRRTFEARQKEYQSEIEAMRQLMKLARAEAVGGELCRRMEAAVEASRG